jgi:hypothetical protein
MPESDGAPVPDAPARVVIDFKNVTGALNFAGWLREPDSSLKQPFGDNVNVFTYTDDDDLECPPENVLMLVPGVNVPERLAQEQTPLLEVPELSPPELARPRQGPGRKRPRGVPDAPFAPHGGVERPDSSGRSGVTSTPPY